MQVSSAAQSESLSGNHAISAGGSKKISFERYGESDSAPVKPLAALGSLFSWSQRFDEYARRGGRDVQNHQNLNALVLRLWLWRQCRRCAVMASVCLY
ncbi:hypothetical protein CBA19CS11_15785 [Caballeronia novacaledonica]|uniref:hypothetical protein n=1 Tax=Caballeronia novacaledonica TaxID=1544861 RepID=UPI001EE1E5D7|nr:hypothetical protein [Caballeronia novacaledonica]GJH10317.1 hypothetical protein CBA19CS11_15785 [Caballeronia novacaledonica]